MLKQCMVSNKNVGKIDINKLQKEVIEKLKS